MKHYCNYFFVVILAYSFSVCAMRDANSPLQKEDVLCKKQAANASIKWYLNTLYSIPEDTITQASETMQEEAREHNNRISTIKDMSHRK